MGASSGCRSRCAAFQSLSFFMCKTRNTQVRVSACPQSESEESLVLDLCFRFLLLFFLSFFFLSFFFFLFFLGWWSEEEDEEEEELSESEAEEEVVSWSSCCSCWILQTRREGRREEDVVFKSSAGRKVQPRHTDAQVGKHLKCHWAAHCLCPSTSISRRQSEPRARLWLRISSNVSISNPVQVTIKTSGLGHIFSFQLIFFKRCPLLLKSKMEETIMTSSSILFWSCTFRHF